MAEINEFRLGVIKIPTYLNPQGAFINGCRNMGRGLFHSLRKRTEDLVLLSLYPENFQNLLITSARAEKDCSKFVRKSNVSSANKAMQCSTSAIWIPLITGWFLMEMAKGSSAKIKSRGGKGYPWWVPQWRLNGLEIMLLVIISAHGSSSKQFSALAAESALYFTLRVANFLCMRICPVYLPLKLFNWLV